MTPKQYVANLKKLGLSVYASGPILGISMRQSQRYASGETEIPATIAKLLEIYTQHGIPKR